MSALPSVLAIGYAIIDYVAVVDSFPKPDDKIRSKYFQINGGGNAFNFSCSLSRFGIKSALITKLGNDEIASKIRKIIAQLERIMDMFIVQTLDEVSSAFSYIIVDEKTASRTIIHTPGQDLTINDVQRVLFSSPLYLQCLDSTSVIYSDGRFTEAAVTIVNHALKSNPNTTILLDCEKDRGPFFDQLINLATVIVTSEDFPQQYWQKMNTNLEKMDLLDCMSWMILHCERSKIIITTLGKRGSILFQKDQLVSESQAVFVTNLQQIIDKDDITSFLYRSSGESESVFHGIYCPAFPVDAVDTTGAGDCFIAGVCYGLLNGMSNDQMLRFASCASALKCKSYGAQSGIPSPEEVEHQIHSGPSR